MSENNPYSTPESELEKKNADTTFDSDFELAGRGERLVAVIVDTIVRLGIFFAIAIPTGIWDSLMNGKEPESATLIMIFVVGFVAFFAINAYLLNHYGQTIGKRLLGIRIANLNGDKTGLWKIIFARYLPIEVLAQIPIAGGFIGLVDALMIFGSERRCMHDQIAGTIVVKAN